MSSNSSLLEKLLSDEKFVSWVQSNGKEYDAYWQRWIVEHPQYEETLEKARSYLLELGTHRYTLSDAQNKLLRQKIFSSPQFHISEDKKTAPKLLQRRQLLWRAAAVFLLGGLGGWLAWQAMKDSSISTYHTAYGEVKQITLPDSSLVTLNANSMLRYRYDSQQNQREVWLSGEGFFDVRRSKAHNQTQPSSFVVHTDQLTVQVLGTRFNVKHRGEKTQVVLEEGSIQLAVEEREGTLLMQPDELIEVHHSSKEIDQQQVQAQNYSTWKEGVLRFEGASFDEISSVLSENYGLTLYFSDQERMTFINLRGTFPADNVDLLLEAIANVTRTSLLRKGNVVEYR